MTLRVTEAGDRGAPVVVLAHGFPELAYSWRHQIPVLAAAGYHVLAPDQRGYGGSSIPTAIEDYDIVKLTGDIAGLLDDVGAEKATLVGHDWGSVVATNFPLLHPDRVSACAALSVPPIPRPLGPPTESWRAAFGDELLLHPLLPGTRTRRRRAWQRPRPHHAQDDGRHQVDRRNERLPPDGDARSRGLHRTAARTRRRGRSGSPRTRSTTTSPSSPRSGFTGPLNWYRNFDRNWELTATTPSATIDVPTLFIGGTADPALAMTPRDRVLRRRDRAVPRGADRRRGPLAAAGETRRGQRRAAGVPRRSGGHPRARARAGAALS